MNPFLLAFLCALAWAVVLLPVFAYRRLRRPCVMPPRRPGPPAVAIRDTEPYERNGAVTIGQGET